MISQTRALGADRAELTRQAVVGLGWLVPAVVGVQVAYSSTWTVRESAVPFFSYQYGCIDQARCQLKTVRDFGMLNLTETSAWLCLEYQYRCEDLSC